MRKYIIVLLALLTTGLFCQDIVAQSKLPDWIFKKPQRSSGNRTFYYHVEKGRGKTETEARNAAYTQAFMQVALKLGIPLNTEDISKAISSGTNVQLLAQRFTIPMNVACYFSRKDDSGWNYWLLCQIPELGYADRVRFDDFTDCYSHHLYDSLIKIKDIREKEKIRRSNTRAIVASSFIPGMGQMLKGQGGAGAAFLVSEMALFGGGTACYFLGQEQARIMKTSTSYEDYAVARDTKRTWDIATYCCFGVGAAVHIANMVQAYYAKDMRLRTDMAFVPALIPTNEYSHPQYAMGAGLQIKF